MQKMQAEQNQAVFFGEQRCRDSATNLPEPMWRYGGRPVAALLPPRHRTDSAQPWGRPRCAFMTILLNHTVSLR